MYRCPCHHLRCFQSHHMSCTLRHLRRRRFHHHRCRRHHRPCPHRYHHPAPALGLWLDPLKACWSRPLGRMLCLSWLRWPASWRGEARYSRLLILEQAGAHSESVPALRREDAAARAREPRGRTRARSCSAAAQAPAGCRSSCRARREEHSLTVMQLAAH